VVSQGPGTLSVIDWTRDSLTGTVKVGTLPHWIAVAPGGRIAYVTNEGSNDLSVVNLDTMSVVTTFRVGNAPRKVVVQPSAASASAAGADTVLAAIASFAFPQTLRIRAGQTVIWMNKDSVPHTVTSDDGTWTSGDIAPGKSWARAFDSAGTIAYHCENHPAMQGMIIVSAAS
jgi:YVTN family beta-propeller protein